MELLSFKRPDRNSPLGSLGEILPEVMSISRGTLLRGYYTNISYYIVHNT
jgi:hypothetical protein